MADTATLNGYGDLVHVAELRKVLAAKRPQQRAEMDRRTVKAYLEELGLTPFHGYIAMSAFCERVAEKNLAGPSQEDAK